MADSALQGFVVKPCQSRISFEFIPKTKQKYNLDSIAQKLRNQQVEVEVCTPFVVIFSFENKKISFYKSGKFIIDEIKEESLAVEMAKRVIEVLKKPLPMV